MQTIILSTSHYSLWRRGAPNLVRCLVLDEHRADVSIRSTYGSFLGAAHAHLRRDYEREAIKEKERFSLAEEIQPSEPPPPEPEPEVFEVPAPKEPRMMLRRLTDARIVREASPLDVMLYQESRARGEEPASFEIDGTSYYVERV